MHCAPIRAPWRDALGWGGVGGTHGGGVGSAQRSWETGRREELLGDGKAQNTPAQAQEEAVFTAFLAKGTAHNSHKGLKKGEPLPLKFSG